jgi:hypothetical protein
MLFSIAIFHMIFNNGTGFRDISPAFEPDTFMNRRCLGRLVASVFMAAAGSFFPASAVVITVPNGDFTVAGNAGTIGGGPLGGSGTDVTIGSGPWAGSFAAIAALLLPPSLNISTTGGLGGGGSATISGIAGINVLGSPVSNSGNFLESTGTAFSSLGTNNFLELTADVSVSSLVTLSALTGSGVGISLLANGTGGPTVASTLTAGPSFVHLTLLSGTTYQLTLGYSATGAETGNIGISLFDSPSSLLTANLFGTAVFSHVSLQAIPEPPAIGFLGIGVLGLVGMGLCRGRHSAVPRVC